MKNPEKCEQKTKLHTNILVYKNIKVRADGAYFVIITVNQEKVRHKSLCNGRIFSGGQSPDLDLSSAPAAFRSSLQLQTNKIQNTGSQQFEHFYSRRFCVAMLVTFL